MSAKLSISHHAMLARRKRHKVLLATGAILPLTLFDSIAWATCTLIVDTYNCSGVATSAQTLNATTTRPHLILNSDATYLAMPGNGRPLTLNNTLGNTSIDLVAGSELRAPSTAAALLSNNSAGTTTMTVGGDLTSNMVGIRIEATAGSTGVHLIQSDTSTISGTSNGIRINQSGSGATDLDINGIINSGGGNAIMLDLSGDAGDARVVQGATSQLFGHHYGINVLYKASGNVSADIAGEIRSELHAAVEIENTADSGDITFVQQAGSSISKGSGNPGIVNYGVMLKNFASGSTTSATILGTITSLSGAAVRAAMQNANGGDIVIYQGSESVIDSYDSSTYTSAITTINKGKGDTIIVADGRVSGSGNGIYSSNYNINEQDLYGNGNIFITTSSDVNGKVNAGVIGLLYQDDTIPISATLSIVQSAGAITGARSGIETKNLGSGLTVVDVAGTVTGGSRAGIFTETPLGNTVLINVQNSAKVSALSGIAIQDHDGDANVTLESGASVTGAILLDAGSDRLNIGSGFDMSGITVMDGGDDILVADGMVDTLIFQGGDRAIAGAIVRNWENVILDGGKSSFTDGFLTTGSEPDTGLSLVNGATLDGKLAFALTGNMNIGARSFFVSSGDAGGIYSISGNVTNAGTVALSDVTPGDRLSVVGNYSGHGGSVTFDTVLGDDASMTDQLVVDGDTSGTTMVRVTNAGGIGAQTVEGIKIIEVAGTSDGVFTLLGDYVTRDGQQAVVGGAYAYTLEKDGISAQDGNWYLRSQLSGGDGPRYAPNVPVHEAYPQALLGLNGLPTWQERVGNRYWSETDNGVWTRIEGSHKRIGSGHSTTSVRYDQDAFRLQAGIDATLNKNASDKFTAGVSMHYVDGTIKINSIHNAVGRSRIHTVGYGVGGSLTWLGESGTYIDSQAQATWYNSDLTGGKRLVKGHDGFGYALSVEGGKRLDLSSGSDWSLTPQSQLVYSRVSFDDFRDGYGAAINLDRGASLQGRLGLELGREIATRNARSPQDKARIYGIANLYYEFLNGTRVDVAGSQVVNRDDRLQGGIGVGGSHQWANGKYAIYGEGLVTTSLNNFGDSHSLQGNIGFRACW